MIRTKNKVFAEANDERTVTSVPTKLEGNKYITRLKESNNYPNTNRTITTLDIPARSLLVLTEEDTIAPFNYNSAGKLIGTDENGNLVTFERKQLPPSPPKNRELVVEYYGSTRPDGIMKSYNELLIGPYWYEVEVSGCGGGGGSGCGLAEHDDLVNGMPGGSGGYYKGRFPVREDAICIIQIGCPGGGASGYITDYTGKTAKLTQGPNGGAGGYTPIKYSNTSGNAGQKQDLSRRNDNGGTGINGGANGGTVYGWKTQTGTTDVYSGAGAGGGANGECGGAGGDSGPYAVSDATSSSVSRLGIIGGAGGAGAGFGYGGAGGAGWSKAAETYGNGGQSYGGGGGGGCPNGTDSELQKAGCGGGGGGAARFVCNDFEVLCGGGGGGSGGCDISVQHSDGRHKGQDGKCNLSNSDSGEPAKGGAGGVGVSTSMKVSRNTSGTTGSRGWIKIWRCV